MTKSGSYDKRISHRNIGAEIDRLSVQARKNWVKESRNLCSFGLEDGMSVLELGSGPGFITEQLHELVPSSDITCIESDSELLIQAQDHLNKMDPANNIKFVEGSVTDTGLPDNHFDFAYARLLYQHLVDPLQATKEISRVLKPGGRLIVHDIDDGLFGVFHPPIDGLPFVIDAFGQAQVLRGGNREIGRGIWKILELNGFSNLDVEILPSHSGNVGIKPFMKQLDPDRFRPLVKDNLLSEESLEQFRVSRQSFMEARDAYAIWFSFMVSGQKP